MRTRLTISLVLLVATASAQLGEITDLSPLHEAAAAGIDGKVSEYILDDPGQIHDRDGVARATPLHLAVENGHLLVTQILLANGALPNVVDHWGWTPLLHAVKLDEIEIA